jgi:hypothetical protein
VCAESNNEANVRGDAYAALIKPGDAIETPDGALWVVDQVGFGDVPVLALTSAYRSPDGRICADACATHTACPATS